MNIKFIQTIVILSFVIGINQAFTVAVIDTGAKVSHPLLNSSIWKNSKEFLNGVDDDNNGFIDDINGFDFVKNQGSPVDFHGHGTHIAGIIQQASKEVPALRLMILKFYDPGVSGVLAARATISALKYAIDQNVDLINFSMGGYLPMSEELELLQEARRKNIVVIAAAGNDGLDLDSQPFYPGSYPLPNVLQIMSIGQNGKLSVFSNFGGGSKYRTRIGEAVKSIGIGNEQEYLTLSGTSQAAAIFSRDAVIELANVPRKNRLQRLKSVL